MVLRTYNGTGSLKKKLKKLNGHPTPLLVGLSYEEREKLKLDVK